MERNIHLTVAYDGTRYHGFQSQANALAIQDVLEKRLALIFGHPIKISGAARTDTGVHAYDQSISLTTTGLIPVEKIPLAAKSVLPDDIVVTAARIAPQEFHARFSACSKIYVYRLSCSEFKDPFLRHYVWHYNRKLDVTAMDTAAHLIEGEHDFSSFQSVGGRTRNPVRTIMGTGCCQEAEIIEFEFWGTGFLYHMVRNLVGTLVEVGRGHLSVDDFKIILAGRDRSLASKTAPPHGLYLKRVLY